MIACIERCEGVIWRHGDWPRRKNRKCHDIFSKVLRRAILTPIGHSPCLSSQFLSVWRRSVPWFWRFDVLASRQQPKVEGR